nr:MAG TPA: hypothetical protein [Caudoviricetes sp.]DAP00216.1 MAG TPA: hypothetical protein [Caudoviricetes sp.]
MVVVKQGYYILRPSISKVSRIYFDIVCYLKGLHLHYEQVPPMMILIKPA